MFLLTGTEIKTLFENTHYKVIENTVKQEYGKVDMLSNISEPNYLIVNQKTFAVEFSVDQLPAAIQVSNKLSEDLTTLLNQEGVEKGKTEERILQ